MHTLLWVSLLLFFHSFCQKSLAVVHDNGGSEGLFHVLPPSQNPGPISQEREQSSLHFLRSRKIPKNSEGLKFNVTWAGLFPSDEYKKMRGTILKALSVWEEMITDPVTVNVIFGLEAFPGHYLGTTGYNATRAFSWSFLRQALATKATAETQLLTELPEVLPPFHLAENITLDPNTPFRFPNALSKSFEDPSNLADYPEIDAYINLGVNTSWDLQPRNGVSPNHYDLTGVVVHEIGHTLGFICSIDGWEFNQQSTVQTLYLTLLDFYRFQYRLLSFDFNTTNRWLGFGDVIPHSWRDDVERPVPILLETGQRGTGYSASHWLNDGSSTLNNGEWIGLMDPSYHMGDQIGFSLNDRKAFGLLGWQLKSNPRPVLFGASVNGTSVSISGMIFLPGPNFMCRFGGVKTTPATVVYRYRIIECPIPSDYKLTYVEVTNDGQTWSSGVRIRR